MLIIHLFIHLFIYLFYLFIFCEGRVQTIYVIVYLSILYLFIYICCLSTFPSICIFAFIVIYIFCLSICMFISISVDLSNYLSAYPFHRYRNISFYSKHLARNKSNAMTKIIIITITRDKNKFVSWYYCECSSLEIVLKMHCGVYRPP